MRARVDDPALDVTPDSVLVLAGCGPVGAAMPEWGNIPIPARLLARGVTDMLRITDGRMSGTGFGTVVLHVAPEGAVGGPLSRLRDGDMVCLDAYAGSLSVLADLSVRSPVVPSFGDRRGWPVLHRQHVLQAPEGCDYDFLQARTPDLLPFAEPVIGRAGRRFAGTAATTMGHRRGDSHKDGPSLRPYWRGARASWAEEAGGAALGEGFL